MSGEAARMLRVTRRFHATPERVFDAWLDPSIAARWLFTTPISEAHTAEIDARIGGAWRIEDRRGGVTYGAHGTYLEIDRPRRLVFTFAMPQFSTAFMARVTIEIAAAGDGCILTLTHEELPWASIPDTENGWGKMFDRLAVLLGTSSDR